MSFSARLQRAREVMVGAGVDAMLLSVGADLPYFTGYQAPQLERLTMAVIPARGAATLVVPRLEAPRVEPHPEVFSIEPWDETDNPVDLVAQLVQGQRKLAIGDKTWSVFLLELQHRLLQATFIAAEPLTATLRAIKDADEIDSLAAAGAAADRVVERLRETRFSGRTERDLATMVEAMIVEEGCDRAAGAIVASGPNGASPHHEPSARVMDTGDQIVVDFGGVVDGYYSDTSRTFSIGRPPPDVVSAYAVLQVAQQAGVEAAQDGTPAQEVDRAARSVIADGGYGDLFIHRTGHGIGLEVHEHPYLVEGNEEPLRLGAAFSVEPGIYQPGQWGLRIEDIVVLTDDGPRRLNESRRDLAVVV